MAGRMNEKSEVRKRQKDAEVKWLVAKNVAKMG